MSPAFFVMINGMRFLNWGGRIGDRKRESNFKGGKRIVTPVICNDCSFNDTAGGTCRGGAYKSRAHALVTS